MFSVLAVLKICGPHFEVSMKDSKRVSSALVRADCKTGVSLI